jgi:hypothetical protein
MQRSNPERILAADPACRLSSPQNRRSFRGNKSQYRDREGVRLFIFLFMCFSAVAATLVREPMPSTAGRSSPPR